jgi:hypothetical protein
MAIRFVDIEPAKPKREVARAILGKVEAALGVTPVSKPPPAVTIIQPVTLNRGRPNSGNAMTPADRQRACRERRAAAKAA